MKKVLIICLSLLLCACSSSAKVDDMFSFYGKNIQKINLKEDLYVEEWEDDGGIMVNSFDNLSYGDEGDYYEDCHLDISGIRIHSSFTDIVNTFDLKNIPNVIEGDDYYNQYSGSLPEDIESFDIWIYYDDHGNVMESKDKYEANYSLLFGLKKEKNEYVVYFLRVAHYLPEENPNS